MIHLSLNYFVLERQITSFLIIFLLSFVKPTSICNTCQDKQSIPFYCSIQHNLPQCIVKRCPKYCEIIQHPIGHLKLSPVKSARKPQPDPHKIRGRSFGTDTVQTSFQRFFSLGKLRETFEPYDESTCELKSTQLKRIADNSKYIEYLPHDLRYQIKDIHEIAQKFGLVMAEFRDPREWWAVEHSFIMDKVSSQEIPQKIYAIGEMDMSKGDGSDQPMFNYMTDVSSISFAVLDPRAFAKWDEQCSILSSVAGSKGQNLAQRFYSCTSNLGDGNGEAHGLFMFPPGSLCYTRSAEECDMLKNELDPGAGDFHGLIEIGQTTNRFIYIYTDQRNWYESKAYCEAKGLNLFDFDPIWEDAGMAANSIQHFLSFQGLNPVKLFWTSGQFESKFSDGKFRWGSTSNYFHNSYSAPDTPPFDFSWWDNTDPTSTDSFGSKWTETLLINSMVQPCVAFSLDPQSSKAKINFKAWPCSFPMYVLCYKELDATDNLDSMDLPPAILPIAPAADSCEPLTAVQMGRSLNSAPMGRSLMSSQPDEIFDEFDPATCTSTSLTAKRLTPTSKFIDYRPTNKFHSVKEIKEHCNKFGLIPAEIRTREDWDSIIKSGIGKIQNKEGSEYFYAIGMDDENEQGKIRYTSDNSELTFSMFAGGNSNINNRCAILKSLPSSGTHELIMHHVNCNLGEMSSEKIANGLCMFSRSSHCYKESSEEKAAKKDDKKSMTIIPLGATKNRTIFFNPVQRNWEDALNFCKTAQLKLLDFDEKWHDGKQVAKLFKERLEKGGALTPHTPIWTSGKLNGLYEEKKGIWQTTKGQFNFTSGIYNWVGLIISKLSQLREGTVKNGCVEATLGDGKSIKLRPDYCDSPKYFLCYRKNNRKRREQMKTKGQPKI